MVTKNRMKVKDRILRLYYMMKESKKVSMKFKKIVSTCYNFIFLCSSVIISSLMIYGTLVLFKIIEKSFENYVLCIALYFIISELDNKINVIMLTKHGSRK